MYRFTNLFNITNFGQHEAVDSSRICLFFPMVQGIGPMRLLFPYFLFTDLDLCGFRIILGASLQNVMACSKVSFEDIKQLAIYYHSKRYLIVVDAAGRRMFVTLLRGETAVDVIQGYFHAVILGIAICIIREDPLVRS